MIASPGLRVYVATAAVFLGAGIVSLQQRLLSVGLADLRGALGFGVDEAAWIPTACDMAIMFVGPFTVYLGGLIGPRRVLLTAAPVFALASFALPFAGSYEAILALQVIVGLSSGTFYPLSLGFALKNLPPKYTIYGIGAFTMELVATLSIATPLQAWFVEHLSYRWIFWAGPVLSVLLMYLVHVSLPRPSPREGPKPELSFRGFLYASAGLALLIGLLEQGERLDWLHSGTIVAMLASGTFLLLAAVVRRVVAPNPLVNLRILLLRNTALLGLGLFFVRFVLLSIVVLVPGYLGGVQAYRALETGHVLRWTVLPLALGGFIAAQLMRRLDGRVVAALGIALVAISALINSTLTSSWAEDQFYGSQLLLAAGLGTALVGQIGMVGQQALETGASARPMDILTYAAFFQTVRLFGGQLGGTVMQRFVNLREEFHSNRLGIHLQPGDFFTEERLKALAAGVTSLSSGVEDAQGRAVLLLGAQVRREANTLAFADAFSLIALTCTAFIVTLALMKPMKIYYDTRLAQVPQ
ncbi:MAG: MFS transporter [Polyangiaceae bacterium]